MPLSLTANLKSEAARLGFVLAGVTAAATPGRLDAFHQWLDSGMHANMSYLESRREAYAHPRSILDGCKSLVMLALPYGSGLTQEETSGTLSGQIARYAQSDFDYHDIIHPRLKRLKQWLLSQRPDATARGIVDTAPLLEREFAELAGLGWVAKNTLLINREWGSYFFIAALLTNLELEVDSPHVKNHCGTCRACLDACPTGAFPEPYILDANLCVSYQTIENRDDIANDFKPKLDGWIFGCDVCQEVCPWNRKPKPHDKELVPTRESLDVVKTLNLTDEEFREQFRKTAFWRPRRRGLLRNAILLAGTSKDLSAVPALVRLLQDDEALLRISSAWALKEIQPVDWRQALLTAAELEADTGIRQQMRQFLE